jgi:hypothetical protein
MKQILTILFFVCTANAIAQNSSFVKYFDSTWVPCTKEKASFYTQFEKQDTVYKCTSYYLQSNKLYGKSTFRDTLFRKGVGLMVRYYESGSVKDSTYFNDKGEYATQRAYYESGQLYSISTFAGNKVTTQGFDEKGNPKEIFTVIQIPAEFPGGLSMWNEYLSTHLRGNVPKRKKAPAGIYTVIVSFIIDKEGKLGNIVAENDPGYGTKEEAIRVLSNSPRWKPAMQNDTKVIYRHRQSISFQVIEN